MNDTTVLESDLTQIGYGVIAAIAIVVVLVVWIAVRDARSRKNDKEEQ